MWFLFLQIWWWLLLAFVLGWLAHWFFCCRGKSPAADSDPATGNALFAESQSDAASIASESGDSESEVSDDWKPVLFSAAPEQVDDLKKIKGIGQVLEETLQSLGVYQYAQIAQWDDDHVAWVDNFLSFPGRIDREDWRGQAQKLAAGDSTESALRIDQDDVDD